MPLFEFLCKKCDKKFEILILDNENIECPKCGNNNEVVKQFSNFISVSSSSCITKDSCSASLECASKCPSKCCHP
jgi:putative FmdB family regulatory protein